MKTLKVSIAAAVLAVTIQGSAPGQTRERSHDAKGVAVERADWYQVQWSPCCPGIGIPTSASFAMGLTGFSLTRLDHDITHSRLKQA